jgi:hypothetical protein
MGEAARHGCVAALCKRFGLWSWNWGFELNGRHLNFLFFKASF